MSERSSVKSASEHVSSACLSQRRMVPWKFRFSNNSDMLEEYKVLGSFSQEDDREDNEPEFDGQLS